MDVGVKNKISLLICFICFIVCQSVTLQDSDGVVHEEKNAKKILQEVSIRTIVKRGADWSQRLQATSNIEVPVHIAEESENVEVTSKTPRIVRRLRIQHGRQQNIETIKEINPESRSSEGGTKIVRIKKFKRKPSRTTTVAPETTSNVYTTTTSTLDSMLTSSSPYSHITVINKEVRNPKKKKMNKKKRLNNYYVPTQSYDSEPKLNGLMYATAFPSVLQMSQKDVHKYGAQTSYPEYGGFYNEKKQPFIGNRQSQFSVTQDQFRNNKDTPRADDNNYGFQPDMPRMSLPLSNFKRLDESKYQTNLMARKQPAPKSSYGIYGDENSQQLKSSESSNEHFKNVSLQQEKNKDSLKNLKTEIPITIDNKTNAQVTLQRAGDSAVTIPSDLERNSEVLKVNNENSSVSLALGPNLESENFPRVETIPQGDINLRQQPYRFPSRYPSLLYNRNNAFGDPFFDTPEIPSAVPRTQQDMSAQLMSPDHLRFSPFYASNSPLNEDYFFGRGVQPYHSEEMVMPGFHHSPELRSLRRSIIDSYEGDTTTSEPVTHFSLPKFEMPPIDFGDKGCQTVYKEVKTVPSDGTESRNNNAKSFVMTRECYFPDGLPTTEKTKEVETTTVPSATKISNRKSKDMKIDSKE